MTRFLLIVKDLDLPSTFNVSDKYRLFEYTLPFCRIEINTFCVLMKMALADCGDESFVTLTALREHLKTPAWRPLEDTNSTLSKFLLSSAFKTDGLSPDQIDTQSLTIFAILNCRGKNADKAEHFFNELQEGGTTVHKRISATDKDMIPVFEKLCALAAWDLMTCQNVVGELYTADDIEEMQNSAELLREDQYLEDMFGVNSNIGTEVWI